MGTKSERLKAARQAAGFRSAREAALTHDWAVSTYQSHEAGGRGLTNDRLETYARAFGIPFEFLLTGRHSRNLKSVRIRFKLLGRGEIQRLDGGSQMTRMLEDAPKEVVSEAEAIIVEGDELAPFYRNGDILYLEGSGSPDEQVDREVMAEIGNSELRLGTLRASSVPGRFHLESHHSATRFDIDVTRAWRISWVRRM